MRTCTNTVLANRRFGSPVAHDPFTQAPRPESGRTTLISDVLERTGAKLIYTYDFGDEWEHSVVLEMVFPADLDKTYPVCIDGERACPPEDCGGVPGFYDLLDALTDPKHEQHEDMREWVGEGFDPEAFSLEAINRKLGRKSRR